MLAFVHIEKTAGLSLQQVLKRSFGTRYCPVERWRFGDQLFSARDYRELRLLYPRLAALGGHWVRPMGDLEEAAPGLRWWTFLREPLARCASHYAHQVQKMGRTLPFEEWIADEHYRDFQTRKLVGRPDAAAALELLRERFFFVGLVERFDESLLLLRRRVGEDALEIAYRPENLARDASLKEALLESPRTRALLEEANREDRLLYEGVLREIYPGQREAYGPGLEADLERWRRTRRIPRLDLRRRACDLKRYALYKPALYVSRRLRR